MTAMTANSTTNPLTPTNDDNHLKITPNITAIPAKITN